MTDLLLELQQEAGNIIVVVTHSKTLAQRMDRQFAMVNGRLEEAQ